MNETECENLIKSVNWMEPTSLISLAILEFINVLVIGGNCLVIAAVFCSNKLRSVTNFFIVNLAVADLLVGLCVLPFSATWEVYKVWIFGDLWCRIWLAVDVWMCTASILNLCAISLDRYVAVTRPVTYPSIMSTKKAKSLIAGIWILSFVICFPPLVGWKDQKPTVIPTYTRGNYTLYYATSTTTTRTTTTLNDIFKNQNHVQQQHIEQLVQQMQRKITITTTASPLDNGFFNPYNPYDPSFAPLDEDDYIVEDIGAAEMTATATAASPTAMPLSTMIPETMRHIPTTASAVAYNDISSVTYKISPPFPPCPWKCELTNDRGYVLYSALGSFYIPMFVMLFFYWRIYRAAVRTTRAINQGFKTTKGNPHESSIMGSSSGGASGNARADDSQLVLRIHRGRPNNKPSTTTSTPQRTPLSMHSMSSTLSMNSNCGGGGGEEYLALQQTPKRATSMRINRQRPEKVPIKVSFPSSENMLESQTITSPPHSAPYALVTSSTANNKSNAFTNGRRASFKTNLFDIGETTFNVDTAAAEATTAVAAQQHRSRNDNHAAHSHHVEAALMHHTNSTTKEHKRSGGKRSAKFQVRRFRIETKAAKTLAIIVGGFIVCWLPFFTMYLIRAFCDHCIQPTVFSVLFWLGYCNSAINPLIYALFSNEFRLAFKRIVCQCVCSRSGFRASENFRMAAARVLMAPATFHKTISGCSDEGDGADFS